MCVNHSIKFFSESVVTEPDSLTEQHDFHVHLISELLFSHNDTNNLNTYLQKLNRTISNWEIITFICITLLN